jgi:hypothetical protein
MGRWRVKILAALVALLLCTSAGAQTDVRAPVNVGTRLYVDCVNSKVQTVREIEPTRVGINEFVTSTDDFCLVWMLIWYRALMGQDFPEGDVANRFNTNRVRILQTITNALRKDALR